MIVGAGIRKMPRILLKLLLAIPLCLGTLLVPFHAARWLQDEYGIGVPSLVTLAVALGVTLGIYFRIFREELAEAQRKSRSKGS
jgi:hypothetical protein